MERQRCGAGEDRARVEEVVRPRPGDRVEAKVAVCGLNQGFWDHDATIRRPESPLDLLVAKASFPELGLLDGGELRPVAEVRVGGVAVVMCARRVEVVVVVDVLVVVVAVLVVVVAVLVVVVAVVDVFGVVPLILMVCLHVRDCAIFDCLVALGSAVGMPLCLVPVENSTLVDNLCFGCSRRGFGWPVASFRWNFG